MTNVEYTDLSRFPLTTQLGLSVWQQMLLDAHNLDELREYAASNRLTEREQRLLAELEAKAAAVPAIRPESKPE